MHRKWLNPEREQLIIELFKKHDSAIKVAAKIGKSTKVVYTTLNKYGIKRTGNRPKKQRKYKVSNCRTRFCPAVIVMLYTILGYDVKQIASATGYSENGTRNVLTKRGLLNPKRKASKSDFDIEKIRHEYVDLGMTSYELGEKYGINSTTISAWMRELGICLGKGNHQKPENHYSPDPSMHYMGGLEEANARRHEISERNFAKELRDKTDGRFEYVSGYHRGKALIRCCICGHEYVRSTDLCNGIECPICAKELRNKRKQGRKLICILDTMREHKLDKTCKECGTTFHSTNPSVLYCSDKCRRRARNKKRIRVSRGFRHYYRVKYGDKYLEHYDSSVTLKRLYKRDGGICQICGKPCNWNDMEWGRNGPTYPSIDHIIPRANGGKHTWDNVQLSHCLCNSKKRDIPNDVAREVVLNIA